MNNVILIGNLTRDPELNYTDSQMAVCRFSIAVQRPKKNGEDQGADFIRIVVFGKQAESCERYLDKGRKVAVQGRLSTGSYKDKDGKTVYTTDVLADRVEFLTAPQGENSARGARNTADWGNYQSERIMASQSEFPGFQAADDDVPY